MSDERPGPGRLEERAAPDLLAVDGKRIRGRIPYGIESRDMGGWREVIEPGALDSTSFDDLVVTVDHVGMPLGRYPDTLQLEDRTDGLHWAVDPPESRTDVREAVERGDLRAGSWRMVVGRDEWRGDVRHVHEIAELRDVAVATRPATGTRSWNTDQPTRPKARRTP
jgi:phage head maturation protease